MNLLIHINGEQQNNNLMLAVCKKILYWNDNENIINSFVENQPNKTKIYINRWQLYINTAKNYF